jgi:hypothetical protein
MPVGGAGGMRGSRFLHPAAGAGIGLCISTPALLYCHAVTRESDRCIGFNGDGNRKMNSTAYGLFALPFIILWIVLFVKTPGIRMPMLFLSALGGLAGPISEYWHLRDYWHPDYWVALDVRGWRFGIEDYLLTFGLAGTSLALFEKFGAKKAWGPLPPLTWKSRLRLDMIGNMGVVMMALFASVMGMNSIRAILLVILIFSCVLYGFRPAWFLRALPVAAAFSLFYFAVLRFYLIPLFPGIIERWWNPEALWGLWIAGVPVEEPLWAFGVALFAGPVYRACAMGRGSGTGRRRT